MVYQGCHPPYLTGFLCTGIFFILRRDFYTVASGVIIQSVGGPWGHFRYKLTNNALISTLLTAVDHVAALETGALTRSLAPGHSTANIARMDTPQVDAKLTRPTVHISPVTNKDIYTMVRLFLLAFQTSEYIQALTPHRVGLSTPELLARDGPSEERRFQRWLVGRNAVHMKASVWIADNDGTKMETIVGWARWEAPPGFRRRSIWEWLWSEILYPLQKVLFRPRISHGLPDAARALVVAQEADTFGPGGIAEGRKHWHLHILCVDPAWQGYGIGGALLKWGTDKAKDTDSIVYLESTPAGRPFYIAKGFRVISDRPGEVNGVRISLPGMIWEPRTVH